MLTSIPDDQTVCYACGGDGYQELWCGEHELCKWCEGIGTVYIADAIEWGWVDGEDD